jgi:hypothetical protein
MIRFLADADLNEGIVAGCLRREPEMDFLSANDADLEGVPDPEVRALAAAQDRFWCRTIFTPCRGISATFFSPANPALVYFSCRSVSRL